MSTSSSKPSALPKGRYVFIDAFRGFAALAVVLFHAESGGHIDALADAMPGFLRAILTHGDLGVQVFFVLSGFVIAHSMSRHEVTMSYVGRFVLRRSIRLDPPFWGSMVVAILFGVISASVVADKVYDIPSISDLFLHVLYLPVIMDRPLVNSVYWTLCLEVQFYLAYCLLMWGSRFLRGKFNPRLAFYLMILPATIFADLWAFNLKPIDVTGLFTTSWYFFLAGVLVWNALAHSDDRFAKPLAFANLAALAIAATIFANPAIWVGVSTCSLILFAGMLGKLTTWLNYRPLQGLGAISYSLYLLHNPISGAAFHVGYGITGRNVWLEGLWFLCVIALCILSAAIFYRLLELPSMKFSRRISLVKKRP